MVLVRKDEDDINFGFRFGGCDGLGLSVTYFHGMVDSGVSIVYFEA